jgi:hypothetical protein
MSEMNLEEAKGWRPEEGDTIIGTVTDVGRAYSDYTNDYYPLITIQPEGGDEEPVAVHAFHFTLKKRLTELRPEVGDYIGIKYHGTRPKKNNPKQTVAVYTAKLGTHRSTASVWDSMTTDDPATEVDPSDIPNNDDIPF